MLSVSLLPRAITGVGSPLSARLLLLVSTVPGSLLLLDGSSLLSNVDSLSLLRNNVLSESNGALLVRLLLVEVEG